MRWRPVFLCVLLGVLCAFVVNVCQAHPVPRDEYDRTIVVHVSPDPSKNLINVRVEYRLEVDPETVVFNDMREFRDQVVANRDYFSEFARIYAPIIAANF